MVRGFWPEPARPVVVAGTMGCDRAAPAGPTSGGGEEARMLVLDRRVQEGFWIGGGIFVKVLSVGRRRVKLGIEAPKDIKIIRDELGVAPAARNSNEGRLPTAEEHPKSEGPFRSVGRR